MIRIALKTGNQIVHFLAKCFALFSINHKWPSEIRGG